MTSYAGDSSPTLAWNRAKPEELEAMAEQCRKHDGHPPLNDQTRVAIADGRSTSLTCTSNGTILGALVMTDGEFELAVSPEYRRRGIATALLQEYLSTTPGPYTGWAHGSHPGATRLADAFGFSAIRTLLQMTAPLSSLTDDSPHHATTRLDTGAHLAVFRPGIDDQAWLELNRAAFRSHPEQGKLTQHDLDARIATDWFSADHFFLMWPSEESWKAAEPSGALGYCWLKIEQGHPGEIYAIGVHPSAAGKGIGRALMEHALSHMARIGCTETELYVEAENASAVSLYHSLGYHETARDVQYTRGRI